MNRYGIPGQNTNNLRAAKRRQAEQQTCPECGRKSAVTYDPETRTRYCRWVLVKKCGYVLDRN